MTIRRVLAGIILIAGAFLLWQGLDAVMLLMQRGSALGDALLQPPTSLWRLVAAFLMVAGSLLVLANLPGGAAASITGAVLFAALPGVMAMMGTDQSLWMDEVFTAAPLLGAAIGLAFVKRK